MFGVSQLRHHLRGADKAVPPPTLANRWISWLKKLWSATLISTISIHKQLVPACIKRIYCYGSVGSTTRIQPVPLPVQPSSLWHWHLISFDAETDGCNTSQNHIQFGESFLWLGRALFPSKKVFAVTWTTVAQSLAGTHQSSNRFRKLRTWYVRSELFPARPPCFRIWLVFESWF